MKKTIRKLYFVWDYDQEEVWLNEMSAKGLHLHSVGFCSYTFDEGRPGEYVYRLEMLDHLPSHAESEQYIHFVEETGAEHIGSLFRWVYFRKKADGSGFDLYSDLASRITHLRKVMFLIGLVSGINLINGINMMRLWHVNSQLYALVPPILCFACSVLTGYGFYRIARKLHALMKEKVLRE